MTWSLHQEKEIITFFVLMADIIQKCLGWESKRLWARDSLIPWADLRRGFCHWHHRDQHKKSRCLRTRCGSVVDPCCLTGPAVACCPSGSPCSAVWLTMGVSSRGASNCWTEGLLSGAGSQGPVLSNAPVNERIYFLLACFFVCFIASS